MKKKKTTIELTSDDFLALNAGAKLASGEKYTAPDKWEEYITADEKPRIKKISHIEAMLGCASDDQFRPTLRYAMRDADNKCEVATCGRKMAIVNDETIDETTYYRHIKKDEILKKQLQNLQHNKKEIVSFNHDTFVDRVGNFPNYRSVIPRADNIDFRSGVYNVPAFISRCEKLQSICRKLKHNYARIRFDFDGKKLVLDSELLLKLLHVFHARDVTWVNFEICDFNRVEIDITGPIRIAPSENKSMLGLIIPSRG